MSASEATAAARPPPLIRVFALAAAVVPVLLFTVAEVVQLAEHGTTGFHRATLLNTLVYLIGVNGIVGASGHLFYPDPVARSIGWPPGNPFQWEVGVADLGWGVLGVMTPSYGRDFWLATIIVAAIFLLGAAVGHVRQMFVARNFAPGNAGGVFFNDVAIPVFAIVLYATY
ncbi:MAG TPA: DUF6790 family protein [Acidimicrobiia bacterium]